MHFRGSFVDGVDKNLHEPITLNVLVAVVRNFERVIEEDVRCVGVGRETIEMLVS